MDRVVVLSVDEVSALIGLLNARWSPERAPGPALADIACHEHLLWSRAFEVSDTTAELLGSEGLLPAHGADDRGLGGVRALLSTVDAA